MKYGVITQVPERLDFGNMASGIGQVFVQIEQGNDSNDYQPVYQEIGFPTALALHVHVFEVGEVLILNDDGREIPYPGRKPAKWSVTCEEFDTVEAALERATAVMNDGE